MIGQRHGSSTSHGVAKARVAAALSLLLAACAQDPTPPAGPNFDDVVLAVGTNDESLAALVGAVVQKSKVTHVSSPKAGDTVTFPATLSWSLSATTASRAPSRPAGGTPPRPFGLADLFEKSAHAHGTPTSGTAYFTTISRGGAPVFRLFTKELSFQPDASQWAKLSSQTGDCTVTVIAAVFDEGRVVEGPYAGDAVTFSPR